MSEAWRDLFDAALAAQRKAYAPYSRFLVGAAVRAASGRIYAGCNVENASYPAGTCAEAGAIAAMVAGGERRIAEALVVGDGEALVTPCGICRQRLREFGAPDTQVHIADRNGVRATFTVDGLLPESFGPENLGQDDPRDAAP
jgi:cytidine deaminase